jgi:hypothetical protein
MKFQDLLAYRKAFELVMSIFETTKAFPIEEKYSLTDQISVHREVFVPT